MRKKSPKKRKAKLSHLYLIKASIIASFLSFLIFSLYLIYHLLFPPFCANSISCIKDLSGRYEETKEGIFLGKKIIVPSTLSYDYLPTAEDILGESTGNKRITVDLSAQTLHAYEGDREVFSFPVSTGKWFHTPTGDFQIWIKLRYTRMKGGVPGTGTYYNLPNVPYTMYFYNAEHPKTQGYGLHGAYWHNNFGHPMSHGCVNISPDNAGILYNWADPPTKSNTTYASDSQPGTPITIYGQTPAQ
ncbi:L,D-transpeptidase [Candidatus Gottesmanbacteria bacterium]|nr:L,D-transpeptidase [Candidatus Gottesmanbacteria bacterium]